MQNSLSKGRLNSQSLTLVLIIAALAIIGTIIAFETDPTLSKKIGYECVNCSYDINEKASYADKIFDPISILTLALVVSTILLWFETKRLASLASIQARDMKKSIRVAQRSARAALTSAGIAKTALGTLERAYVFVETIDLRQLEGTPSGSPFRLAIQWRNSGNTRTKRAFNHVSWWSSPVPLADDFPFDDMGDISTRTGFMIAPQATAWGASTSIPFDFMQSAFVGNSSLYIYGWFEYDDILSSGKRHRTEFCVKVEVLALTGSWPATEDNSLPQQVTLQFLNHHLHNGADEDCLKPVQT